MNRKKRYRMLSILEKYNPNPSTELLYSNSFELLIAILLSAQTTDKIVNQSTKKLFLLANTPEKMLSLGVEKLKIFIKKINFFNKKANYIINLCSILIKNYNSKISDNRDVLESLPGVGRKTANVLLNIIFKKKTIGIDTHVYRVCNRTRFATAKSIFLLEKKLLLLVPHKFRLNFHHWFVLHGRYICTAKSIKCHLCCIEKFCEYDKKKYIS